MFGYINPKTETPTIIANFIKNCTEEIKMIAGACGENNIHNLNKGHLRALNSEIAKITKIKPILE